FEETTSPLRYNSPADDPQSWLDTERIFYFDADGNRYPSPSHIYRDLEPQQAQPPQPRNPEPQSDSYRREDDTNVAPWERSDDTDSDDEQTPSNAMTIQKELVNDSRLGTIIKWGATGFALALAATSIYKILTRFSVAGKV